MKKLILLIGFVIATVAVIAQSTTPRYGTLPNQDNTGRNLTYHLYSITDKTGVDTVTVRPTYWQNDFKVALVDTLKIQAITKGCYFGDNMRLFISGTSGKRLRFLGNYWQLSAKTLDLSTGTYAIIELYFNGTKWVELSRIDF
jgi:hypothetical protein